MRVLLISGNREDVDIRVPPLGLACIAASTERSGHEVRLLDFLVEKDPRAAVAQAVQSFNPEAIGVSVRNIDDQRMHNTKFLLDQVREAVAWCQEESAAPIILGGAGFSILPQAVLNYVDAEMGIQGEGEAIFPELLQRIHAGEKLDLLAEDQKLPAEDRCGRNIRLLQFVPYLRPCPDRNVLLTAIRQSTL